MCRFLQHAIQKETHAIKNVFKKERSKGNILCKNIKKINVVIENVLRSESTVMH